MKGETLLHRQIHPSWVQNQIISSQAFHDESSIASLAFIPSPKDAKKLSVYNGDKFTPEESYLHYTKNFPAAGVLSVTMDEVESIGDLSVYEDNIPFDGHSVIDYSKINSSNQIKKEGKKT